MSESSNQGSNGSPGEARDMIIAHGHPSAAGMALADSPSDVDPIFDRGGLAAAAQSGVSLSKLLRRKWTMLLIFLIVSGVSIPLIWRFVKPEYVSTATIRVAPLAPRFLYKIDDPRGGGGGAYTSYLNTQVSVIRHPDVFRRALEREEIKKTAWYSETASTFLGDPPSRMERLAAALKVRPRRGTELIDISIATNEPKDAKVIVDVIMQHYLEISDDEMRATEKKRFETLRSELQMVQNEVNGLIGAKFSIAARFGSALPEDVGAQLTGQLHVLQASLTNLQIEQSVRDFRISMLIERHAEAAGAAGEDTGRSTQHAELDSETGEAKGDSPTARLYAQDSTWILREEDLDNARHELKLARQIYGDAHPTIKALIEVVGHAERLLVERTKELEENPELATAVTDRSMESDRIAGLTELQRAQALEKRREEVLDSKIKQLMEEIGDVGGLARGLAQNEELLKQRKIYRTDLRTRLQALEMESKAPGRITMASPGLEVTQPTRDRRLLLTAVALLAGLLAAVAVAYFLTGRDLVIYEPRDMGRIPHSLLLGQLPLAHDGLDLSKRTEMEAVLEEGVRMVRTTLLQRLKGSNNSVVAITSPTQSAGKTTLAILLARSLHRLGKKVLLVDGDFRQPALSRMFGAEDRGGLTELLAGESTDQDVIIEQSGTDGPYLLPAGRLRGAEDNEMLANGVMSNCIRRWKTSFDVVLVDTPPVLSVADGRILASQADSTVMVLRASTCTRLDVVEAFAGLESAGASLLGTVLVGSRERSAYHTYGYA